MCSQTYSRLSERSRGEQRRRGGPERRGGPLRSGLAGMEKKPVSRSNQPYRCSIKGRLSSQIAVTRSAPHMQVNKLIGDLHKQFLEQGSNKVILAFSLPFSIVSAKKALENVNLLRVI